jgi:hypothetical protein
MENVRSYRTSFLKIGVAFSILPVGLSLYAILVYRSPPPAWITMGFGGFLAVIGLACLVFPVRVSDTGIHSYDSFGRYQRVRYTNIQSVGYILGYIVVRHGKPGSELTIPRFLSNFDGFKRDVIAHAPADNPLRSFLEQRF